jgi:hypothetical protein
MAFNRILDFSNGPDFYPGFFLFRSMLIKFWMHFGVSQEIRGVVTDSRTREPMTGATVFVKETGKIDVDSSVDARSGTSCWRAGVRLR